ncbi:MAG: choice-of-anchor D domain-containing protein [Ignavibacteriae bacterium]|nr:choice-of-anchor D domain-containing protein [Ignavibacteriota bacterium]
MQRKILFNLIATLFLVFTFVHAQAWKEKPGTNERNLYSLQQAFNQYWEGKDTKAKGKGWKQFKRWEWFWQQRVDENGDLPASDILYQRMKEYSAQYSSQDVNAAGWTLIGPSVVPSSGGGAGRVNCVAVNPSNTNMIFAGSASGGLWKSTNGGTTWTSNTDALASLGVTAIVFDPNDSNIMYMATGDADAGDTYSIGVLKSVDGGTTWSTTGLNYSTSSTATIRALVAHPTNSNILLATTNSGIYRTTNAGTNWSLVSSGTSRDLEVNKTDPTVWYATKNNSGVYKSIDGGATFSLLSGVGLPASPPGRIGIAVAASSPSTVYALYVNATDGFYGLYKTTNAGASWSLQSNTPNILSWDGTGSDGQGWYDLVLDVDPTNAAVVYVGGVNMYKSTTSGTSWTKITHWYSGAGYPYIHADQHGMTFHPTNNATLFVGNDGGVFKSTNSGSSWSDISSGLAITQFYRLGVSQTNVNRIFGGTQDNGTNRVLNGAWEQILGGDGMESLIDYSDENIGYAELYYGDIYRTTNGGNSFSYISGGLGESGGWVTPYIINPINPKSIYVGTTKVYKSTNRGTNWAAISGALSGGTLASIAIAKSDTNTIYAGDYSWIYRTTNGGSSWTNITSGLPSASKTYIAVHPNNKDIAFVTISGYGSSKVYKTTNGGSSWTSISSGLPSIPTNCIVIHPTSTDNMFVGTDVGVYSTTNGGTSWSPFSLGLPNVVVNELEFHTASNKLRAATYGRGFWETSMGSGTGSIYGTAFFDANNNGTNDAGDVALSNWTINLTGDSTATATTDASGNYVFANIKDGQFTVTVEQQPGWTLKTPVSGNYQLTITDGTTHGGKNFVNYIPGIYENFDGALFPPSGWTARTVLGDSGWRKTSVTPRSGSVAAFNRYQTAGLTGRKMLISKKFSLGYVGTKEVRFYVRREFIQDRQPDTLYIKLSQTDSISTSFTNTLYACYSGDTTLGDPNVYSTTYKQFVVSLNDYTGPSFLAFEHQDNNGQSLYLDDIMINVGSVDPVFSATPDSLAFGLVNVNTTKRDSITVTNLGSSTMSITSVSSSNNQFLVTPLNGSIASLSSKKFYITFYPTTGGAKTGNIIFTSNSISVKDTIRVDGTGALPQFSIDSSTSSFGNVTVGHTAYDTLTVTNTGTATLNITNVSTSNVRFLISPTTATLAPSASQLFIVAFTPTSTGAQSSSIYFASNSPGSQHLVTASGTGVSPGFNASPSSLSFSKLLVSESAIDSVTVSNFGDAELSISSVISNDGQFTVEPASGVIASSGSLVFTITFTPTSIGLTNTALIFTHDAITSPDTVFLSGRGADTVKFRTFSVDTALAAKANKIKVLAGKPAVLPNVANWRDSVVYRYDKRKGVYLGLPQTGSAAMRYGWMRFGRGTDVGKFYKTIHTNIAYNAPFDTVRKEGSSKKKRFIRELRPTSEAYTNPLAQAFAVFKLNLYSSKLGITPKGLDSLVYVSEGSEWDGMTLTQIANRVDSVLTKYLEVPLPGGTYATAGIAELEELRSLLNEVNDAFYSPIAFINGDSVVTGQGLRFAGMIGLETIPFLDKSYAASMEALNSFTEMSFEPTSFELYQNYPNPFNPTTNFGFRISDFGLVTLKVFNLLGQEVATLLSQAAMDAGEYEIEFDASSLSSGVYFYQLRAESMERTETFFETKKLLLLR